jgi:hypothetical protein
MSVDFTEEDEAFVKEEYAKLLSDCSPEDYFNSFYIGCTNNCRLLIKRHDEAVQYIADAATNALRLSKPLSMIRIGDSEGTVLGFGLHDNDRGLKWCNSSFQLMDRQTLTTEAARSFAHRFAEAVCNADIIGLVGIGTDPKELQAIHQVEQHIHNMIEGDLRVALGFLRALQYGRRAVETSMLRNAVMTNAWVHMGLIEHLDFLLASAPRVLVITGRHELEGVFAEKLKGRLAAFMAVPVQASDHPSGERPFHYPTRYNEICNSLRTDLGGSLVLVGAGIFGKVYCDIAKRHGGVALDLGSVFDVLAGKVTRPVHSNPAVVGSGIAPWIKGG